jgi:O-antigen/teichoic acid export membrane protein
LASLTTIALPLGAVMAIISLQTNIPRYVLERESGKELLGYFGAIVYPMMAGMMVTTAMGQSASPRLARYYIEDVRAFVRLLIRLTSISAGLGLVIWIVARLGGDWLLEFLYGPRFAAYHREFEVLAIAAGIQLVTSCMGYGLTAAKRFRVQVVLTVFSCAATAAASVVLIPRHAVMGACVAVLVTALTMNVGCVIAIVAAVRRAMGTPAPRAVQP